MATQLLTLALSLLIAAQQSHVPTEIRNTAISVAQNAIKVALEEQVKVSTTQIPATVEIATSTKVENIDSTNFPIVGTLGNGQPIYQGRTGFFVINSSGCHNAVALGGSQIGPQVYCPEN
jgi:hypothetical protein